MCIRDRYCFRGNGSILWEGNGCYFLLAQKVTKDALGVDSGERLRAAGAHSHLPPKPPYLRGTPSWKIGNFIRRAKTRSVILLASGTQAPTGLKISEYLRCTDTAYPGKTVAAGQLPRHPPDLRRTKQVGGHQAVVR